MEGSRGIVTKIPFLCVRPCLCVFLGYVLERVTVPSALTRTTSLVRCPPRDGSNHSRRYVRPARRACHMQNMHAFVPATATLLNVADSREISQTNLLYVKVPKAASSTTGGVARRIAAHHGLSGYTTKSWITSEPGLWANHGELHRLRWSIARLRLPSFLFSVVREPAARCLSEFYHFNVSRGGRAPSVAAKINFMSLSETCRDFQFNYLRRDINVTSVVNVLSAYDMVGVAERYDEAMVTLLLALRGVRLPDLLFISSKNSSEERRDDTGQVMRSHPPLEDEPLEVRQFAQGAFREFNQRDYSLWGAAMHWQATIADSWPRFAKELATFRRMQERVARECAIGEQLVSLKSAVKCYWNDNGCNYACLDGLRWTQCELGHKCVGMNSS